MNPHAEYSRADGQAVKRTDGRGEVHTKQKQKLSQDLHPGAVQARKGHSEARDGRDPVAPERQGRVHDDASHGSTNASKTPERERTAYTTGKASTRARASVNRENGTAGVRSRGGAIRGKLLLGDLLRGSVFFGAGYLLASAPLALGAVPLGIGLLAASSAYTRYILVGALLGGIRSPGGLSGWAWLGIYVLCLVLRLCIRFFVDPPALPDGRPCTGRMYLRLAWISFKRNIGLLPPGVYGSDEENTVTDYYGGEELAHTGAHGRDKQQAGHGSRSDAIAQGSPTVYSGPEVGLFAEHPFLRMLTAVVTAFAAGVCGVILRGFHVYDLLSLLVGVVVAPVACALWVSCFGTAGLTLLFSPAPLDGIPLYRRGDGDGDLYERDGGIARLRSRFHALPMVGVATLLMATVFAARGVRTPLGTPGLAVEGALLLALLLSLLTVARMGVLPGMVVALLTGLSAGMTPAPICLLCVGGYAILRYISHRVGLMGGMTAGTLWCMAMEGVPGLVARFPAMLFTIPVYLVYERLSEALPPTGYGAGSHSRGTTTDPRSAALSAEWRAASQRRRLEALSDAFGSLSSRFSELSGQFKKPRMPALRRLCDEAFGAKCAKCPDRNTCWGTAYDRTLEVEARLAARLHAVGHAGTDDLPDSLLDFCPYMEEIVADINTRCAGLCERLLRAERTDIYAADYAAVSTLLREAVEEDSALAQDMESNRAAAACISDYLSARGVRVLGVVVCGKRESRRRQVIIRGEHFPRDGRDMTILHRKLEEICEVPLASPRIESEGEGGISVMTLVSEATLSTAHAAGTMPAGSRVDDPIASPDGTEGAADSPACGDHVALFKTDSGYFYALISDGMGSGEGASVTSDICAMFLEKMLLAGNRLELSLGMLDGYLRAKNTGTEEECSATVDLMELDLIDGEALFAKSGAAPTYVVREGTVYKLALRSMPIGILENTPPRLLRFHMRPGDVVVMVSDGVTLGNDECPWLLDLLASPMPSDMNTLRTDILRRALKAGSEDDLSAIAIRVDGRP